MQKIQLTVNELNALAPENILVFTGDGQGDVSVNDMTDILEMANDPMSPVEEGTDLSNVALMDWHLAPFSGNMSEIVIIKDNKPFSLVRDW